ncbi:L10-interacting MYB domain-containing protein-like [Senna tora]|uniref:L10-interacting MYB domain-containing protein-like n=1 Tax=Senna tora TaxID=362788 RepID=A0A834TU30_9FABA|nr:L10-interacting MYB domain-containing protein-like [Senna tora]
MPPKQYSNRITKQNSLEVDNVDDGEGEGIEKAKWDDRNTKEFLKACVEEIFTGNRPHSHFNKEGWRNVKDKFNERTGHAYVHKQIDGLLLKVIFLYGQSLLEKKQGSDGIQTKRQ